MHFKPLAIIILIAALISGLMEKDTTALTCYITFALFYSWGLLEDIKEILLKEQKITIYNQKDESSN